MRRLVASFAFLGFVVLAPPAGVLAPLGCGVARADDFPQRPVTIVVPFTPGGSSDAFVRIVAAELTRKWGQQIIIDNRAGGSTVVGSSYVAKAKPDGYTLVSNAYPWVTNQFLMKSLPYTPDALAPITLLGHYPQLLFVRADLPVSSLAELIAYAKKSPKPLTFGNAGVGTSNHLAAVDFVTQAGLQGLHVPYKGSSAAMNDLVGGQIDAMFEGVTFKKIADGKRIKALFVAQPQKLAQWPELPTSTEAGLPSFRMVSWYGLMVPGATPEKIRDKLAADVNAALAQPDVQQKLLGVGLTPAPMSPAAFAKFLDDERTKLGAIITRHRIQLE